MKLDTSKENNTTLKQWRTAPRQKVTTVLPAVCPPEECCFQCDSKALLKIQKGLNNWEMISTRNDWNSLYDSTLSHYLQKPQQYQCKIQTGLYPKARAQKQLTPRQLNSEMLHD